jgi:GAF domain-containing protein
MNSMTCAHTSGRPTASPLTATLRDIVGQCVADVATAAGCGLLLLTTDGRRITSVATDPLAERLNVLHDSHRENPFRAAWSGLTAVGAEQSTESSRWPSWMACARELGAQSVLTSALNTRERSLGVVMVYSTLPMAFDAEDHGTLETVARRAALVIDEAQNGRTSVLISRSRISNVSGSAITI